MSNVVITGANRGIGLELAQLYLERGEHVIAACRKSSADLDRLGATTVTGVDVSCADGADTLAKQIGDQPIDLLINNAGILLRETLDDLNFDQIRMQFEVNALGPLRITKALLPRMKSGSKIALITSRMGSMADNSSGSRYGYRMSKAALNMAGVSLAHDLKSREIAVALLHPGFVQTEMTGRLGDVTASESARNLLSRIDQLTLQASGTFWHANGEVLPW